MIRVLLLLLAGVSFSQSLHSQEDESLPIRPLDTRRMGDIRDGIRDIQNILEEDFKAIEKLLKATNYQLDDINALLESIINKSTELAEIKGSLDFIVENSKANSDLNENILMLLESDLRQVNMVNKTVEDIFSQLKREFNDLDLRKQVDKLSETEDDIENILGGFKDQLLQRSTSSLKSNSKPTKKLFSGLEVSFSLGRMIRLRNNRNEQIDEIEIIGENRSTTVISDGQELSIIDLIGTDEMGVDLPESQGFYFTRSRDASDMERFRHLSLFGGNRRIFKDNYRADFELSAFVLNRLSVDFNIGYQSQTNTAIVVREDRTGARFDSEFLWSKVERSHIISYGAMVSGVIRPEKLIRFKLGIGFGIPYNFKGSARIIVATDDERVFNIYIGFDSYKWIDRQVLFHDIFEETGLIDSKPNPEDRDYPWLDINSYQQRAFINVGATLRI